MKKTIIIFLVAVLFNFNIRAEDKQTLSAKAEISSQIKIESRYYRINQPFNREEGKYLGEKLDAFLIFFNQYFHFDTAQLSHKLNIIILPNKKTYNQYLKNIHPNGSSFVYVQYRNNAKSKLVGYLNPNEDFNRNLIHYAFIQYLRTFIQNPPLWLEKGFAVYFEKCKYREKPGEVYYKENLTWLTPLKENSKKQIPLGKLLKMNEKEIALTINQFHSQSWGLVSFLLNYPDSLYNRIIWDTIRSLSPKSSRLVNITETQKVFGWINFNRFSKDYANYINSLYPFPELIEEGIKLYNKKNYNESKIKFIKAISLEDENYVPYYYLGLINYNLKDFAMAEFYFNSAIQLDGDKSLCYYALSINAYAENNFYRAKNYLKKTVESNGQYTKEANEILNKIEKKEKLIYK